jgi:hypothetical protein
MHQTFAQSDAKPDKATDSHYGVRTGFYYTSYLNSPNYFAYLTFGFGNHEFGIGPSVGRPPTLGNLFFGPNFERDYRLNGIDLTYRIFPNGKGKIFDFYFQADLLQKWGKGTGEDVIYNWPTLYEYNYIDFTVKSLSTQLLVEFGFDAKFLKYLYAGPAIGIGGKMEFRNHDYGIHEHLNIKETLFNPEIIFRVNLGARF